ncbi:MAG: metallophosphoesterase [Acutalibacteraceae bacterium]
MSLYTIGDLHLSLGTDKPMDIFSGWGNYTERLKNNWEKLVNPDDTVVIAGDISWAMNLEDCYNDFSFINSLPGKKIILKGNHDYWWSTKKKMDEYTLANGFETIDFLFNNAFENENYAICGSRGWALDCESDHDIKILNRETGRLLKSISEAKKFQKEIVCFLHYPPIYGESRCQEILDILKKENIKKCFYGHIHGKNIIKYAFNGTMDGIEFKIISADSINFTPYLVR